MVFTAIRKEMFNCSPDESYRANGILFHVVGP